PKLGSGGAERSLPNLKPAPRHCVQAPGSASDFFTGDGAGGPLLCGSTAPFFAPMPSAIVPPLTVAAQQRLPAMGQTFALHHSIIAIASGHPQRADDERLASQFYRR